MNGVVTKIAQKLQLETRQVETPINTRPQASHAKKLAVFRQQRSKKKRRSSLTDHFNTGVSQVESPINTRLQASHAKKLAVLCQQRSKKQRRSSFTDPFNTGVSQVESPINTRPQALHAKKLAVLCQRRSKKQQRASLTPTGILETVNPAAFSLLSFNRTEPTNFNKSLKKRVRAELDAVTEEQPMSSTHQPENEPKPLQLDMNLSGLGPREARRVRKELNYALPSLNKKMQ
ncbi:hypothetical protein O181_114398 [Austropuccinia psidii MF-1]|uniref:Shugoshin C-terminal domain-containing protein n=1 Tax=Austropuccinia psidii MF-1 TaxID=1389203 RepID=A0A9Q3PUI5_9BASI|nr:hypothetical protein [Austropuccinia psidii MF-1]